jgi:co-chaperonin GroES (HSP10)
MLKMRKIMIEPLGKKVYIAEVKTEKKSAGGIILEGVNSIRETKFAEVLAVGYEVRKVRVGNRIVLDWSKCYPVKENDIERAIVDEEHILAVHHEEQ